MNSSLSSNFESHVAQLAKMREWEVVDGSAVMGPQMSNLVKWLDSRFVALAVENGAAEILLPGLIGRSVLERAGYFESFPQSRVVENSAGECLPPAACYHCHAKLALARVEEPVIWTCMALCCRDEKKDELGRLGTFSMREVVFVGTNAWVRARRQEWMHCIFGFARKIGLVSDLRKALDPFFGGGLNRGRRLLQQLKGLKYELSAPVSDAVPSLAISSFNLHEAFFSRRFGYTLDGNIEAYSACVAFGLERWALALVAQLGADVAFRLPEQEPA